MTIPFRTNLSLLAVVFLLAGMGFARPQWLADIGLDVGKYRDYQQTVSRHQQVTNELDERGLRIKKRVALKFIIADDLIAKRITLEQATEQFLELNRADPRTVIDAGCLEPAVSEKENTALQVMRFARLQLNNKSSGRQEALRELARQFDVMRTQFANAGAVQAQEAELQDSIDDDTLRLPAASANRTVTGR